MTLVHKSMRVGAAPATTGAWRLLSLLGSACVAAGGATTGSLFCAAAHASLVVVGATAGSAGLAPPLVVLALLLLLLLLQSALESGTGRGHPMSARVSVSATRVGSRGVTTPNAQQSQPHT